MEKIEGFVEIVRDMKNIQFIIIRDREINVQVVIQKNEQNKDLNTIVSSLTKESSISIFGIKRIDPKIKLNGFEIEATSIIVHSISEPELPISELSGPDTLADWRFLNLRKRENRRIFELQSELLHHMRNFYRQKSLIEIFTPKLLGTASESGAEVFTVDYYGEKAYLAQSPQFYKQMAIAADFESVFEIAPAFRADSSNTNRHSSEFISVDVELAWVGTHHDVMDFEEEMLRFCIDELYNSLNREYKSIIKTERIVHKIPRITFEEARHILVGKGKHIKDENGKELDIDSAGERILGSHALEHYKSDFIFITDYPSHLRPFYHERDEFTGKTKSFDLLFKGIEITSGAKREHRHSQLLKQIHEKGLNPLPLEDYTNFFRFGCPPHGGFGMGLSRLVMMLLGLTNIKEVELLHRDAGRLTP